MGFYSSHTLRTKAESLIVRLGFNNGISGYGESSPRAYVTGENCATVTEIIINRFASLLFSKDIEEIDDVEALLNDLEEECLTENKFVYNSALGAIDIALLDALAKHRGLHVTHFLGQFIGKTVPSSISIPILSPKKIEELFHYFQKPEFKHVKVLLGANERENIERVCLVKSLLGKHVDVRVEVNGRWTFLQALSNLKRLAELGITAAEQPLPKDDIDGLRQLKTAVEIPLIADESMCSLSDAKNLIERQACDILNIKISKCGGLLRSKRIAQFAQSRNIPCQLGSHVGESAILSAAAEAFVLTTPNLLFSEINSSLLFEDSQKNTPKDTKDKIESNATAFGLGISAEDEHRIERQCSPILQLTDKG